MPPANTEKVRAAWKQKFRSACRPFRLIRMALQERRFQVRNRPLRAERRSEPFSPNARSCPRGEWAEDLGVGRRRAGKSTPERPGRGKMDGHAESTLACGLGWFVGKSPWNAVTGRSLVIGQMRTLRPWDSMICPMSQREDGEETQSLLLVPQTEFFPL